MFHPWYVLITKLGNYTVSDKYLCARYVKSIVFLYANTKLTITMKKQIYTYVKQTAQFPMFYM